MNYEYAKLFSFTDVIIVFACIIMIIIGFKKGFLIKMLEISRKFCGLIVALLFCVKFANALLYPWFGEKMTTYFYNNIMSNESFAAIADKESAISTLKTLGIPEFISTFIINSQNIDTATLSQNIANNLAVLVTTAILVVLAFIILWIGTKIVFWILKLLAKLLRTSIAVKIIDGILGIVLQLIIFYVILQILTFIVIIIASKANIAGFNQFVTYDILGLTSGLGEGYRDRGYSISGWLYQNNFLGNLIGLLF